MEDGQRQNRIGILRSHLTDSYHRAKKNLWKVQLYNIQTFRRQPLAEISGSVGDIGTLLPILIALTDNESIYLSSTLIFSGLANIFTGLIFGIPLPVQPMKAIAAVAIARNFTPAENASAGLFVAGAIGFLSITGLIQWFTKRIPIPVIKGIQVGTGLSLLISAGKLYHANTVNNFILFIAFLGLLASARFTKVPYALLLLVIGVLSLVVLQALGSCTNCPGWPRFSVWLPQTLVPSPKAFAEGALGAGVGQLPLTALNSVIAVSFLAADLLPDVPRPSTTSIGFSVMTINLVGCWFGAMPVCHGSGGLAAQYRFGARSGASIIFLGVIKLLLGLFAERIAHWAFLGFPSTLLCILIIAAGLELAKVGESLNTEEAKDLATRHQSNSGMETRHELHTYKAVHELTDEERKRRWIVMLVTVAGILAFRNDAVGFLAGMLCFWSFQIIDKWEDGTLFHGGRIRLTDNS